MKIVELTTIALALAELLNPAGEDTLILKTSEGREFVLAEVDDFDTEIALVRHNEALMALLAERSREQNLYTLLCARATRLGISRPQPFAYQRWRQQYFGAMSLAEIFRQAEALSKRALR